MIKTTTKTITLILLLAISVLWAPIVSHAAPNRINYQGVLEDSGGTPVPDASYDMIFRVYDAATAGILLWEEGQTVATVNGIYNVLLGSVAANIGSFDPALFSSDNRWLEVEVSDEILTPRRQVTSVAFALRAGEANNAATAGDADTVDGAHAAALEETAEIDADISTHAADASVHHTKTSTFPELSGQASDAQIPPAIARDSEIFPIVLKYDGSGSKLDADALDGLDSSAFLNPSSDYGRSGVASNLYEGTQTLANKYVNVIGDTMTGALNLTTDGLVAGTDQLVLSGGNVGIGTATPSSKLEVRGGGITGFLGYFINDNNSSSGNAYGIYGRGDAIDSGGYGYGGQFEGAGGGSAGVEVCGTRNYAFAYGSSKAYGVYSNATLGTTAGREYAFYGLGDGYFSGNVGIGTTIPSSLLHVYSGSGNPNMKLESAGIHSTANFSLKNDAREWTINVRGDASDMFAIRDETEPVAANRTRLAIAGSGNVGIGTTSPTAKLDIAASGAGAKLLQLSTEREWAFRQLGTGQSTALELASIGGGGNKNFVINTTGNVGIGTTSPAANLEVAGTAKVTGDLTVNGKIGGTARGIAIYTGISACGSSGVITLQSTCTTEVCAPIIPPLFFDCNRNCSLSATPFTCSLPVAGYLVAP